MKLFGFTFTKIEAAIVIAFAVIAFMLFFRWAKAKGSKLKTDAAIDDAISEGVAKGEALSYDDAQFQGWANTLQSAMDGTGTDEQTIYNIFKKLQHTTDLLYLIKKYGHRDKRNLIGRIKGTWDLSQWLTDELDAEELSKLNKILVDKSIRYQF